MGVRGMNLIDGDTVQAMQIHSHGQYLLIVSEKGMGKRTLMNEFNCQNRGGKGVKCYKITEKTGNVLGAKAVDEDDEIMLITTEGIIIRLHCLNISVTGRITSGVKLMDLEEGVRIAKIAKVRERISDGEQEFDNPEDAMEDMEERPEEEMSGVEANQSEEILESGSSEEEISGQS